MVGNDSEDEEFLDRAEEFEKVYNFRFEVSPALLVAGCMPLGTGVPSQRQGQSASGGLPAAAGALTCTCPGTRRSSTSPTSAQGQHEAEAACGLGVLPQETTQSLPGVLLCWVCCKGVDAS